MSNTDEACFGCLINPLSDRDECYRNLGCRIFHEHHEHVKACPCNLCLVKGICNTLCEEKAKFNLLLFKEEMPGFYYESG